MISSFKEQKIYKSSLEGLNYEEREIDNDHLEGMNFEEYRIEGRKSDNDPLEGINSEEYKLYNDPLEGIKHPKQIVDYLDDDINIENPNEGEIFISEDSGGLPDDHSMLWDRDEEESESPGEEESEPTYERLKWSEVDLNWTPNWLQSYTQQPGPSSNYPGGLERPIEFFSLFFDDEVINLLVQETNRYSEQFFNRFPNQRSHSYYKQWIPCDADRIKGYLGILIHMGLSRFHHITHHWQQSLHYTCSFCPNIMSREEFTLIHKFFHIVNNETANKDDKLHKIRPLFNLMVKKYQHYYTLNQDITIDERMVKYTGRLSFKQYIKNKPVKLGIKVFVLADSINGYVYNWEVYSGGGPRRKVNLAYDVVKNLVEGLYDRGHKLYTDSYYTSIPLVRYLATRGIGCLGMIKQKRKFLPKVVKDSQPHLQENHGVFRRAGNMLCFVFKDKRELRMLTNIYGRCTNEFGRPQALVDYNFLMHGVDKSNRKNSYYNFRHKSMKWYKTLFMSILETSISNAYELYKYRFPIIRFKPLGFRERLSKELAEVYLAHKHHELLLKPRNRIIKGLHKLSTRVKRNCCICSTTEFRRTTIYYCVECDKNVCPTKCFYLLHTKLAVKTRYKNENLE